MLTRRLREPAVVKKISVPPPQPLVPLPPPPLPSEFPRRCLALGVLSRPEFVIPHMWLEEVQYRLAAPLVRGEAPDLGPIVEP